MNCRLSTARQGCAATAVHNRYIVIVGGITNAYSCLSLVEILDTNTHVIGLGPRLFHPRAFAAVAVVPAASHHAPCFSLQDDLQDENDNDDDTNKNSSLQTTVPRSTELVHVVVVGGYDESNREWKSVEVWECQSEEQLLTFGTRDCEARWIVEPRLTLEEGRSHHGMVVVGQCLIVAGGMGSTYNPYYSSSSNRRARRSTALSTVQVLDWNRKMVWNLPDLPVARNAGVLLSVPPPSAISSSSSSDEQNGGGLVLLGGCDVAQVHALSLFCPREMAQVGLSSSSRLRRNQKHSFAHGVVVCLCVCVSWFDSIRSSLVGKSIDHVFQSGGIRN